MSYTLDYFVGVLKCPVCGVVSEEDEYTNIQTYIRSQPELACLGVGHPLEVNPKIMGESNYLTIQLPQTGQEIRILETWECPSCDFPFNWAEIVVYNGLIETVEAVPLNRQVLEQAHFITHACISAAADLTGVSQFQLIGSDLVQILKERLPNRH